MKVNKYHTKQSHLLSYLHTHFADLWPQAFFIGVCAGANHDHAGSFVWQVGGHLHTYCVNEKQTTKKHFSGLNIGLPTCAIKKLFLPQGNIWTAYLILGEVVINEEMTP